jgi:hypothetical protein
MGTTGLDHLLHRGEVSLWGGGKGRTFNRLFVVTVT